MYGTPLPAILAGPMSDREAITDTCYRAFASIDHSDKELLLSSVTPDVQTDIASKACSGADELLTKVWDKVANKLDTIHYLTNVRVSVDTYTTARVTFTAMSVHCRMGMGYVPGPNRFTTGAIYNCDAVKLDGIWKLKMMKSHHMWGEGDPSVMAAENPEAHNAVKVEGEKMEKVNGGTLEKANGEGPETFSGEKREISNGDKTA